MMWTLYSAASEFGTTRETLKRNLQAMGLEVAPKSKFTTQQIMRAVMGDLKFERTRRERAEADKAEVDAKKAKREVIDREEAWAVIRSTFPGIREDVISLPSLLAAKCNPANPQLAADELRIWGDTFLKRRREMIPEPEKMEGE